MIYVFDNFLPSMEFDMLATVSSGPDIFWKLSNIVSDNYWNTAISKKHNFQFIHIFLDTQHGGITITDKRIYSLIEPLVNKINPDEWYRIKMNLNLCSDQILEHGMHIDNPTTRKDAYTALFYINDNDGYTVFKTGEKIESVSNRLVVFPANLYHSGTTCTNASMRIVVNFNFYKNNIDNLIRDKICH